MVSSVKITLYCLLSFTCAGGYAQTIKPEVLNIKNGLSQGYTPCLLQDREGFLWVGTKNGLNRYDGRHFKVFNADPGNPYAISHDFVRALWEFGDFILVGTNGGGLNILHKKTQRFYKPPIELPGILQVATDAQGDIWLLDWQTYLDGKLHHIELPKGFWQDLSEGVANWEGIVVNKHSNINISRFYCKPNGHSVYYTQDSVMTEINTQNQGETKHYWHGFSPFSKLQEDSKGRLWLDYNGDLYYFQNAAWAKKASDFKILAILSVEKNNHILLKTNLSTVILINLDKPVLKLEESVFSTSGQHITNGVVDLSGNTWFGTNGYGLFKINPRLARFKTLFENHTIYSRPFAAEAGVFGYYADATGVSSNAMHSNHPLITLQRTAGTPGALVRHHRDNAGKYWLLYVKDYSRSSLAVVSADGAGYKAFPTPVQESLPGNLSSDGEGKIWIGLNGRLYSFDPDTEQFTTHDYSAVLPFSHEVRELAHTPDGKWWLGTSGGLVEARPQGNSFEFRLWKNDPQNIHSLSNDDISCLLIVSDAPHRLWIGTKGGGLNGFDTRSGSFSRIGVKEGLPNPVVYGIVPDDEAQLWLSTNWGLVRYNPISGAIRHYTESDGLQADEFNTWAYGKSPRGEMMFGGINGLNVFHPGDMRENPTLPPVYITDVKINNKHIAPGDSTGLLNEAIEYTAQLRLAYSQNSITLTFAALEFTVPSKNRFRYYLEGAELPWAHEGYENTAQYLNLPPGSYTFHVMAANNDGVWNPQPASLQIVVRPPWYRSIWAWTAYVALLGGLLGSYFRFRLHQVRLQQQLEMEQKEAERIRELDHFKNRLYTNITHEFRTPLTVILGAGEQLESQLPQTAFSDLPAANRYISGFKNRLALIRRNGRNLLDLVNQLLDLAKAENKQLQTNLVQGDMIQYVRYVVESFHSLANHRNVLLRVETRLPELVMDYDPEKIRQILSNLISNALKYAPSEGKISVRIDKFEKPEASTMVLEVSDTGAGIAPEDLPHIFDRFYQADNDVTKTGGTGIGLALTRELVNLLGGDITVDSTFGQGAAFKVVLPISNQAVAAPASSVSAQTQEAGHISPTPRQSPSETDIRILIVEDNADVVEYLRLSLQDQYVLSCAYNGRSGIEIAFETAPDLILSDVMMPEKDGFELCDILKSDERTSHIPIVLLTAKADVESRIAGLRKGADAYLAKPFHQQELLVTLEALLENRRRLQARYGSLSLSAVAADEAPPAADTAMEDAFLTKLRTAIEERLGNPELSADDISRVIGMGRSNLYAKLSALTGMSFNIYMRSLRLRKAKILLSTTGMNVSEVAWEVGFNDPKYFSRVFSEEFGLSPSDAKKK